MLDPTSAGRNFEFSGEAPYLYLVQRFVDRKRNVVRFPLAVTLE